MKNTDKKRKYSSIIAFLLITALLTQEGFLPFLQTGALDTQMILADDFSSEEGVTIDEFDQTDIIEQDQTDAGSINMADGSETDQNSYDPLEAASPEQEAAQTALTTSDGESKLSVYDDALVNIYKDAVLSLRSLKDKEITGYLNRARQVLNWEETDIAFIRIYDPVVETADGVQFRPDSPAIVEIRLWDETTMSGEQKEQFIRQNAGLLDVNRHYTSLDEQFLDVRSAYIRQMHLENLYVVSFGSKDEQPETSLEDGVIRFKTEKLHPFILLMQAGDQVDNSSDFSVDEDPAESRIFEDPETEKILEGMKEEDVSEDIEGPEAEPAEEPEEDQESQTETGSEEDDQTVEAEAETEEESSQVTEEQQLVSSGDSYEISVSYTADAQIPEGSELVLNEIPENAQNYRTLKNKAVSVLDAKTDSVLSVTLIDVSIDNEGETIEPEAEVGVTVQLTDQEDNQALDTQVIAINDTAEVLEVSDQADAYDNTVNYETASQTMDTVYAIVTRSLTKELLASDGNTYEVTVTYQSDAGIPAGAELEVKEIPESAPEYETYLNQTADALSTATGSISYTRMLDISIMKDGEKIEIAAPVDVKIQLKDRTDTADEELSVVHFGDEPEVVSSDVQQAGDGDIVRFVADGFSVYVIVAHEDGELVTPQVEFHYIDPDYTKGDNNTYIAEPYRFRNKNKLNTDISSDNDVYQTTLIVKNGEVLESIEDPENKEDRYFFGWYLVNVEENGDQGSSITYSWEENPVRVYSKTAISVSGTQSDDGYVITWTQNGKSHIVNAGKDGIAHVYLAAVYEDYYYINFHKYAITETDSQKKNEVVGRKLVAFGDKTTATVRVGKEVAPPQDPTKQIFSGWQTEAQALDDTYDRTVDRNENELISPEGADGYYITVTNSNGTGDQGYGNLELYPVFSPVRWIRYNVNNEGATYVSSQYLITKNSGEDDYLTELPETQRNGYTFSGWYTAPIDGQQVTDANGQVIAVAYNTNNADTSVGFEITEDGKLYLYDTIEELPLYAHWTADDTTSYKVVIWKQKVTDDVNATDDQKDYDFEKVYTSKIVSSSEVVNPASFTDITDKKYNLTMLSITGFSYNSNKSDMSGTPKPDGSTVYNIYYDRNAPTLTFQIYDYIYTATTSNSGNQYGLVNGKYVDIHKWNNVWYQYYSNTIYSGTRYTRSTKQSYQTIKEIHALYEQNISSYFPIIDNNGINYAGYVWEPQNSLIYTSGDVGYIDTMQNESTLFRAKQYGTQKENHIYYYVQSLPGESGDETYEQKDFIERQHLIIKANGGINSTEDEEFAAITGFTKFKSNPAYSNGTASLNYDNNYTIKLYYTRNSYNLTFNVNYPIATGLWKTGQVPSSDYTVPEKIMFEKPLTEYDYDVEADTGYFGPNGTINLVVPDNYTFGGWYEDSTCQKEFDFDSTMPAANKVLYAKWIPLQYQVTIEPEGGQVGGDSGVYATYYNAFYGKTLEDLAIAREYVPVTDVEAEHLEADKKYFYLNYAYDTNESVPDALHKAEYIQATETAVEQAWNEYLNATGTSHTRDWWESKYLNTAQVYRKVNNEEHYAFLGLYQVDDNGNIADMPYDFAEPVTGDITLRAKWRLEGRYQIKYIPYYDTGAGVTLSSNSDADWVTDPENASYTDLAIVTVSKKPTNPTAVGGSVEDYVFQGWQLVNVQQTGIDANERPVYSTKSLQVVNGKTTLYDPGDEFTVHARYADNDGILYMQAVYTRRTEDSGRRPEVTDLTLDANGGHLKENASPEWNHTGTVQAVTADDSARIVFSEIQNDAYVDLKNYAVGSNNYFEHEDGYFLLGFDASADEGDYAAAYAADGVIGVDTLGDTDHTLYAVWEPMVYVTFVNDTDVDNITISLEADGDTLYIVNQAGMGKNAYARQKVEDVTSIKIPKGESVRLAIPNGAGRDITVKGKNTLGIGYLLTANATLDDEPHKLDGALTNNDLDFTEVKNNLPFGFFGKLAKDAEGVVVTFKAKRNPHTLVLDDGYEGGNVQEIYLSESAAGVVYDGDESKISYTLPGTGTRMGYELIGWSKETPVYPLAENYTPDYAVTSTDSLTIQDLSVLFKSENSLEKPDLPVRRLYAVWKVNTASRIVQIYKNVPEPGNQNESFKFKVSLSANFKKNLDSGKGISFNKGPVIYELKHGQYLEIESENQLGGSTAAFIRSTVRVRNADKSLAFVDPNSLYWSAADTDSGTFSNVIIKVEEEDYSEEHYTTSAEQMAVNTQFPVTVVDSRTVQWTDTDAGGTVVYTNTRQTADITVKKHLQSNSSEAADFGFTASYTLDGKNYSIPFTLSSGNAGGYVLEKIPVGVELTITEAASDSYVTSASSGNGAEDTNNEDNIFTLHVAENDTITFTNILKSYKVIFRNVDQNGNPVEGTYTLSGIAGSHSSTGANAQFYATDHLYVGSYTLSQSYLSKDHQSLKDAAITVSGSGITCNDTENIHVKGNAEEGYVITVVSVATKTITVQATLSDELLENYQTYAFSYTATYGSATESFTLAPSKNTPAVKKLVVPVGEVLYVTQVADVRYDTEVTGGNPSGLSTSLTVSEENTLIFANSGKTVDITVTKAVLPDEGTETYTFTAKVGNGEKPIEQYDIDKTEDVQKTGSDGTVSFTIARNESKVLTIPSGATLTITETNVPQDIQVFAKAAGETENKTDQDATFKFVPTEDTTVTFTNAKCYTITWVNDDDTELRKTQSAYGTLPAYDGETPVKEATAQYTYTFAGWTPEIKEATGDVTYKAFYTETLNKYTVTWKNDDGTVLKTDEDVDYGIIPTYDGETPTKEQTVEKTFIFTGWTPEVSEVTGDVTYTAVFKEEPRKYTITWKNYDQSVIKTTEVPYGEMPVYDGAEPARPQQDEEIKYSFAGWTPEPVTVTGEASYTAVYALAVLEIELTDSTDSNKAIAGAEFQLFNDMKPDAPVWAGVTDANGRVRLCKVSDENAQDDLAVYERGAQFAANSSYTLKQTKTAEGYIVPVGNWTVKVDAAGTIASPLIRNAAWDDYTTLPRNNVEKYGIRFDLQNAKTATLTYRYNMPVGEAVEDMVETLNALSYNLAYTVDVEDPIAKGYEFVGWLDENNNAVKHGDNIVLNTVNTKEHVLDGCWRAPLNVAAKTYNGGHMESAAAVEGSAGVFETAETYRNYTDFSTFCKDYGNQKTAVKNLNESDTYEFVQARLGDTVIAALRYNVTDHKWQYQKQYEKDWTDWAVGDELILYYAKNKVQVAWVRMDDETGALRALDEELPDKELQIDSVSGITEKDLFDLIGTNAREAVVEKDCYFRFFGLGRDSVENVSDLIVKDLDALTVKNTVNGFMCGQTDEDVTSLETIYLVYSPDPPENSAYLDMENYSVLNYAIDDITVNSTDLLSDYRAIQINRDEEGNVGSLSIYDGGSGAKHAGKTLAGNGQKIELVLLDAAQESYIINGSFEDTDSRDNAYELDVAIASSDRNTVTHTLLHKAYKQPTGDVDNQLLNTGAVTEGTLDPMSGKVTVAFDDDLAPFTFEKHWSVDAYPEALTVNFDIFEIPGTTESNLPAGFNKNEKNDAVTLRNEGVTVWQYAPGDTYTNLEKEWTYQTQNLPKRNLHYAVETTIMNGSEPDSRFNAVYELSAQEDGGWKQTVTNNRIDNICRVGEQEFKTIQRAVDYIVSNRMTTGAVIEMLCDYIMSETYVDPVTNVSENAIVTIPEGYDITLTTKEESDTPYTVSRGYNGAAMFTVNGQLTVKDLILSAVKENDDNLYQGNGNGGFVNVSEKAVLTVQDGTRMTNGRAENGSAIYVQDGGKAVFTGGTITGNRTTGEELSVGGAIAVGGENARIELSGDVVINNNYPKSGNAQHNIYLDQDSNEVIQVTGSLGDAANVGVYIPDGEDLYTMHGLPSKPFAVYVPDSEGNAPTNLDHLWNDRYRNDAGRGYASTVLDHIVVWGPTFDLVADIHWLNEEYQPLNAIPEGAQAEISLNPDNGKGYSTKDQKNITVSVEGDAMKYTFRGLAVYNTNGNLCEYYVKQERLVAPAEGYKQIKFIGDVGVKKLDPNDQDPKNVNIPLKYNAAMAEAGKAHVVNLYEHRDKASFTITKIAKGLEENQSITSTFTLYGVKKGLGMGGVSDLPMSLRLTDTPPVWSDVWKYTDEQEVTLPVTSAFFQVGGGNQWYCQTVESTLTGKQMKQGIEGNVSRNGLVKFHTFYSFEREQFTVSEDGVFALKSGEWMAGDVIEYNGDYKVYTGSSWYDLTPGASDAVIRYTRQDGNGGALNRDGGIQLPYDIRLDGYGEKHEPVRITADNTKPGSLTLDELSSEYYWYAVETAVQETGGQNRSLSSFEWLVAAYDPQYVYDQAGQTLTVTNTLRNGLATYKKWPSNLKGGTATFEVYRLDGVSEPFEDTDLKALIDRAYGTEALTLVSTFTLPEENGSYVHVDTDIDVRDGKVYFVKETEANGMTPLSADIKSSSGEEADCKYWPYERLNHTSGKLAMYKIENQNEILCKVVDPDGTEHPFRSLNSAYKYGKEHDELFAGEFTIEMLKDYTVPASDCLIIESGRKVTLTTAAEGITRGKLVYGGRDGKTRATLTRLEGNQRSLIRVEGNAVDPAATGLTLNNIEFTYSGEKSINYKIGNATYYNGAYVYAANATVALNSVDQTEATGVDMTGGLASNGGAVYTEKGSLSIDWAKFERCKSTDNSNNEKGGGAILVNNGKLTVTNSEFTNCTAIRNGGAVSVVNASAEDVSCISDSTFNACTSKNIAGAIYSSGITLQVENSVFKDCETNYWGGAIGHNKNTQNASTNVQGCVFTNCRELVGNGNDDGGGAINTKAGELHIKDSTFEDCFAYSRGGAIQHFLTNGQENTLLTEVVNSKFYRCQSQNSGGGAMCVAGLTVRVEKSYFEECRANNSAGGAVDIAAHGKGKIGEVPGSVFKGCYAYTNGGAISMASGELAVNDCEFQSCEARQYGGGVSMEPGASDGTPYKRIDFKGSRFNDCKAGTSGGAVYSKSVVLTVGDYENASGETVSSSFTGCQVTNNHGGAIYQEYQNGQDTSTGLTPTTSIFGVLFENCQAKQSGGAVRTNAVIVSVEKSTFDACTVPTNNGGDQGGGGIFVWQSTDTSKTVIRGSLFKNCAVGTRTDAHGGAVFSTSKTLLVDDYADASGNVTASEFTKNKASGSGGAIYTRAKLAQVENTSFKDCGAATYGGGIYHYLGNTSDIVLTVKDSTFDSCAVTYTADNYDPRGGGVYTNADYVGVSNTGFWDCVCTAADSRNGQGGGLYVTNSNLGTVTHLRGTIFTRCSATGNSSSHGGSVYTSSRTLEVQDGTDASGNVVHSTFTDSSSTGYGGGICQSTTNNGARTVLNMSGADFERCQAVYTGGGIYTNARDVVVENTALEHCKVERQKDGVYGGGLRVDYGGENSSTTLRGVRFEDCQAVTIDNNEGRGGGAYISSRILTVEDYQDAEENITHSSFIDCHSTHTGGAIHQSNTTLSAVTVIGTTFEDCDALYYGGAIQSEAINTTIKDSSFERCKVECNKNTDISGGAVRAANNSADTETIVQNSSFEDCYASTIGFVNSYGGTIYASTKKLIAGDGTTIKNSHTQHNGGGIYHNNNSADSVTTLDGLTLENCYSSASRGGGVCTWAMEVTVKDTQVKDCYANNWGGGISHDKGEAVVTVTDSSFENCYTLANNDAGGGGMRTNAVKLDIKGTSFTGCYTKAFHGGALYHGYNDNAETVIEDSSFQDCYCAQNMNGGAIYHFAKKLSLVDTAIDGGEIEVNANKGGGIFSERAELTLTGCVIRNCAAFNSGGGIYQNNNNNRDVILDNTKILNNSAANNSTDKSGNKDKNNGGGVYFRPDNSASTLTLRNGVVVSGNRLTYVNSSVDVAAGIYLYQNGLNNNGTLVVGTEGSETADTITVWDNTAMDGAQSNVRLNSANPYDGKVWMRYNNRSSSVRLYSDLKNSRIGVVNPGVPNSQFGISMPNNHSGAGGFVADDMSMTGKINPNNTDQIIWYKPPVCKITDNNGNVLTYISGETKKIAVYNSLAEAIRDFNAGNTSEGHFYDGVNGHKDVPVEPMQIQMLTPAYTMTGVDADLPAFTRNVTLTTAEEGDTDKYYYPSGSPDAVIHRGNAAGSLFSAEGNITVTVTHLTLDGGNADITANGALINARGAKVVLGQDAVLQNGKTSLNGGAVYLSDGAALDMTKNAAIQNCQASNGGAVYVNSGSEMVMTERSTIAGCAASVKGGAMFVVGGGSVDLDGTVARLSIKDNHVSEKNGGAGIYLAANTSSVILNGMLDFDGNTVTTPNASGTENGAENYAYARQDLYLAANTKNDVSSITIAGNLTNGHGDDGFIWVWAENENHYKKDDQFANIQSGVTVQSFTLNAFRDAQDDATIGNKTEQYYTGVADKKNANRVLWGVDIVDVTFLKTDGSGRGLSGAVFTVYPNTGSDNQETDLKTPLRYRGGTDVTPESDEEGRVAIQNVLRRGRTYYMKETTMPAVDANGEKANFGINDSLYLITIHSNDEVAIQVQNGTSWIPVSKLKDSYQIVNEPVICKVVDTDNTEHAFGTLNAAVDYIRKNRSKAYHSGIATIQMLVDYTMPSSDRVTLTTDDVITLTTAHTAKTKTGDEHYLYMGDNGETSIIRRGTGYSNSSMIEAGGSGSLKLENITLDGKLNNRVQQTNADGGFVSLSGNASLTVGEQATLQNTRTSGNGGAVYAAAGTRVTVSGGTFTDCTASGNGGAICALTDSVILGEKNKTSTITDCSAKNGGSVYLNGNVKELMLTDITISNSKASAAGGAVYLESSANAKVTVTLINSKMGTPDQANEAGQKGGCLYTKADELRIELDKASLIGYSKTTSSSASHGGGAIAHEYRNYNSSTFTLTGVKDTGKMQSGTVISSTSAASGGGLDISAYRVTINGVTIQKCDSEGSGENGGGGVYLRELSVLEMTDCTIDACNSATMGGGILIKSASTNANDHSLISGTTFTACTASKSGGKGGGVYVKNAMLDVEGCTFGVQTTDNNTRNNKRCQANAYGGAICAENATLNIDSAEAKEHTFFYGDNAGSGGGICTLSNSIVKVYGASFEYCSGNGGGMYLENTDSTVTGCRFISCSGSNNGGGIRVKGTMNDRGLTIQDMEYKDGSGATSYISTEFRGCKGNNGVATGSALYIEDTAVVNVTGHTRITMKLSEEDNNPATVRGCAVYVAGGGLLNFGCSDTDAPSITDYCLSNTGENGAGIYLGFSAWNKYGKLNLQGNPLFSNNKSGVSYSGTFGGAAYKDKVEQDIYVNMSGYDNVNKNLSKLEAITVKGNLNSPNGIYVFVTDDKNRSKGETDQKHFKLGDQFGITVSTGISDETLALFKNARLDEDTNNTGTSILVGVRGEEANWVYWGSQDGTDVSFMKVDHQSVPLGGAEFKLYMDVECKTEYTKNEEAMEAISADGKDDKDSHGTVLEKGTVLFEKLPSDVYYLKEEKAPEGYTLNESVFIVLVGKQKLEVPADSAKAGTLWDTGKVLEKITQDDIEDQRGKKKDGTFERDYAIFRIENGQAALSTDVAKNGIMNYSAILRKVILRKVSDTYESLSGAEFQIYRNDGSLVSIKGDKDQELTSFESGVNGVYFIGDLPYGIYYLHETKVPGSMKPNGDEGWWYYLIVHESGIYVSGNDTDHKGGYTSENLAEEAAKEKYEAIKSTQTSDNSSGTGSGS